MGSLIANGDVILHGLWITVTAAAAVLALATLVGTVVAVLRLFPGVSWLGSAYVEVFQNTPYPIIVFFIYYGLPEVGLSFGPVQSTVVGIGLYSAAFIAEALRSGVRSVSAGNWDAGYASGLSRLQVIVEIVMRQAVVYSLPSLTNQWCRALRNVSVMAMIGGQEILFVGSQLAAQTFQVLLYYGMAGVAYWLLSVPITMTASYLEAGARWTDLRMSSPMAFVRKVRAT